MASRFHGKVAAKKATTRTAKAKKAKDVRKGKRARTHSVNARRGF